MSFNGFGSGILDFLSDLKEHNDREWFGEHKDRYERQIREPAEAFIVELGRRLSESYPSVIYDTRRNGGGSLMRIYRDARFAKDKRPFKENVGIIFPLASGKKVEAPMFYFHVELGNIFFYGGQHVFTQEVLDRYRRAVDDGRSGVALSTLLSDLDRAGYPAMEDPAYKRVPRPYPSDHQRGELLKQTALGVGVHFTKEDLGRPGLVDDCVRAATTMRPLMDWLFRIN